MTPPNRADVPRQLRHRIRFTALALLVSLPLFGAALSLIEVIRDLDGLGAVSDLTLSPDGIQLYAVGADDNALIGV